METITNNARPAKTLPVLTYSTGAGWEVLGYAKSAEAAKKVILRNIGDHSKKLLAVQGWVLSVAMRTSLQVELNGGPEGWIFGVCAMPFANQ